MMETMEVNMGQGSMVKDEEKSEDDITVLDDDDDDDSEDKQTETIFGSSAVSKETSQPCDGSQDRSYPVHRSGDNDRSSPDHTQEAHGGKEDTEGAMPSFTLPMESGLDQAGWIWNHESEGLHGSKEMAPNQRGGAKVRRFQCGICGTNFTLLKNAKRHYRCQHLNYYYWCKYCPNGREIRRYTRREFLEDHFLSHHPEMVCEVAEVGKSSRSEDYNIISVDIFADEEDDDDVGVDLVSTTDTIGQGSGGLEPRGAFDNPVMLQQEEQMVSRRLDSTSKAPFINLADFHGYVNDMHTLGSNQAVAAQKRSQEVSPSFGSATKTRRMDNDRAADAGQSVVTVDDVPIARSDDLPGSNWVSRSGFTHPTQTSLTQSRSATTHEPIASTSSQGQSRLEDVSYSASPLYHAPTATAQDCLIIGSAISQPAGRRAGASSDNVDMTPTTSLATSQSHRPSITQAMQASPQIPSSSRPHQGHRQQSPTSHLPLQPLRKHTDGRADQGQHPARSDVFLNRNLTDERNLVNSSSDGAAQKARNATQRRRSREVVLIGETTPTQSSLSCKDIFDKYKDDIGKYSKEIDYKYDSSGRVVRRKTVKHIFVFKNSDMESLEQERPDVQTSDRSASR